MNTTPLPIYVTVIFNTQLGAARLLLDDNIVVRVLRDFPTPQHRNQQLPQLQIKAVVGMLIMAHRG